VSTVRTCKGRWERSKELGPNGRLLCRNCGVEVPKGRRTFCGDACVSEWCMRSDVRAQRQAVLDRDHGICAICGRDCIAIEERLTAIRSEAYRYGSDSKVKLEAWTRARRIHGWRVLLGLGTEGSLWQADHIKPVVEGGGPEAHQTREEILANLRTVCIPCHKAETRALAARRAAERRAAKERAVPQLEIKAVVSGRGDKP
jgi:5-methylcytosine-specific restriction enzyme A